METHTFARILKKRREERGLTESEVAGKMDMTKYYYRELESGKQSPTLKTIARLARALECRIAAFFTDGVM
jgi:transcriptional regulator with XRE-family HTH domain